MADSDDKRGSDQDETGMSKTASAYRKAAPILDASWQMAGAAALGSLGGWWLDKKLGTSPWLLVSGAMLGIGAGLYAFLKAALAASKPGRPQGKDDGPHGGASGRG